MFRGELASRSRTCPEHSLDISWRGYVVPAHVPAYVPVATSDTAVTPWPTACPGRSGRLTVAGPCRLAACPGEQTPPTTNTRPSAWSAVLRPPSSRLSCRALQPSKCWQHPTLKGLVCPFTTARSLLLVTPCACVLVASGDHLVPLPGAEAHCSGVRGE